jgi:hypothetical protein
MVMRARSLLAGPQGGPVETEVALCCGAVGEEGDRGTAGKEKALRISAPHHDGLGAVERE